MIRKRLIAFSAAGLLGLGLASTASAKTHVDFNINLGLGDGYATEPDPYPYPVYPAVDDYNDDEPSCGWVWVNKRVWNPWHTRKIWVHRKRWVCD
jgi:hypothetical protein